MAPIESRAFESEFNKANVDQDGRLPKSVEKPQPENVKQQQAYCVKREYSTVDVYLEEEFEAMDNEIEESVCLAEPVEVPTCAALTIWTPGYTSAVDSVNIVSTLLGTSGCCGKSLSGLIRQLVALK